MLNNRDAFKIGFLSRCVEEGLTLSETHGRVKEAMDKLASLLDIPGKVAGGVLDAGKSLASTALGYGIPLALAGPPILGGLAGYGAAKLGDVDDTDVKEVKKRELIDELQQQTERLQREKATRDFDAQRKRTGRVFL
jgi:hypothetical protein